MGEPLPPPESTATPGHLQPALGIQSCPITPTATPSSLTATPSAPCWHHPSSILLVFFRPNQTPSQVILVGAVMLDQTGHPQWSPLPLCPFPTGQTPLHSQTALQRQP